ncbi:fructosamine kinase family protein [Bacillaceae bacterium Marseille-Q3522]|nr:fructosamine kinase family protein [Bacillaceae bacterium Marseille-Q3522]
MLSKEWLAKLPIKPVTHFSHVSGGDINEAYAVTTQTEKYFLKVQRQKKAEFFAKEAVGLKLLGKTVRTPEVIELGEVNGDAFLLLEWIDRGSRNDDKLGTELAALHQQTNTFFGLSEDNYLGRRPQINHLENDWTHFYIHWRIMPLVKLAKEQGMWNLYREKSLTRLIDKIKDFYKNGNVSPSLIHGDLWSGNVMFDSNSEPVFIDPAVCYANREMDIAMTLLFGGFGEDFYRAYQDVFPLADGWQERIPWYQLYYLLAHLLSFGEGYGAAVDRALNA